MKKVTLLLICIFLGSCKSVKLASSDEVSEIIDSWHAAAATANFTDYFDLMTTDAIFIGTDATENWTRKEFQQYSKPYFDKGKAWSFTSLQRNVYYVQDVIYFDELLDTQMGICRGSGVLKKENGTYKIAHYVLSIAVPNETTNTLTGLKKNWDASYILQLKSVK